MPKSQPLTSIRNSILDPQAIVDVVTAAYALEQPITCTFIQRGFNDHYLITAGAQHYICRVYLNGKYYIHNITNIRFELDLLTFLHRRNVPVAYPLPRYNGDVLGIIPTAAGARAFALFTFAEGQPADEGHLTQQQSSRLGAVVATFHQVANQFSSHHPRYHLNLEYLLIKPLALIQQRGSAEQRAMLSALPPVEELVATVRALPITTDEYGIIHGDLHLGNMHFTADNQATLFDFDHCAHGWRAYDLAVLRTDVTDDGWEAFLESYQAIRPLTVAERRSIPIFVHLRSIWDEGDILAMEPLWHANQSTSAEETDRPS